MTLILASGSRTRRDLLARAGLEFQVCPAPLDEREVEAPMLAAGANARQLAAELASAKALEVSRFNPEAVVIGADQTLELDGARLHKPADAAAARRQLLAMSGKVHHLHSAVCCARAGTPIWQGADTASIKVRQLAPEMIDRYLQQAGPDVLSSVGAYQIEGLGIQLFDDVQGDYFTILGLPLLPLLAFLRSEGFSPW